MQNNNHSFAPEVVMAYLDGELTAAESLQVAAHVEGCPECTELANGFRRVEETLSVWRVQDSETKPDDLPDALAAALEKKSPITASRTSGSAILRLWDAVRMQPLQTRLLQVSGLAVLAFVILAVTIPRRQAMLVKSDRMTLKQRVVAGDGRDAELAAARNLRWNETQVPHEAPTATGASYSAVVTAPSEAKAGPTGPPLLAKSSDLKLRVARLSDSRQQAEAIIRRRGGYVGNLDASSTAGEASIEAAMRVPASELDATLGDLRQLGRVEAESIKAEDVTRESVDLDARIANTQVTEQRLIRLLQQQTAKLTDVLEVEQQLARVRGELEQMVSERKNLTGRISYATISLTIREEFRPAQQSKAPLNGQIREAYRTGIESLKDSLVGILLFLLEQGPKLLFVLAAAAMLLMVARRILRRRESLQKP